MILGGDTYFTSRIGAHTHKTNGNYRNYSFCHGRSYGNYTQICVSNFYPKVTGYVYGSYCKCGRRIMLSTHKRHPYLTLFTSTSSTLDHLIHITLIKVLSFHKDFVRRRWWMFNFNPYSYYVHCTVVLSLIPDHLDGVKQIFKFTLGDTKVINLLIATWLNTLLSNMHSQS